MLTTALIGNVGADAEFKSSNGREFTTFRVAHNDSWTDDNGVSHNDTKWVDCILNGHPNVANYIKQGTQVYVYGRLSTRVYSSAKLRCMVAGITINVMQIELLGGNTALVPKELHDAQGVIYTVQTYYNCGAPGKTLLDRRNNQYVSDDNGWVLPVASAPQDVQQAVAQNNAAGTVANSVPYNNNTAPNSKPNN